MSKILSISSFKKLLSTPKHVVITMHHRPDADALGSSLGLASFLRKGHHQVSVIAPTPYPNFLAWMPGSKDVIIFCKGNKQRSFKLLEEADIVFCLDCSAPSRIDEMGEIVKNVSGTTVVIDHHLEPQDFTDLIFWNPNVSATAELVYTFIEQLGGKERIDKDIAECLGVLNNFLKEAIESASLI